MGKKTRDRSETDRLLDTIRTLKSENRHLKKLLNGSTKKIKQYEEHIDLTEPEPAIEPEPPRAVCPECAAPVTSVSLGVKLLITCTECKFRKTMKK